jgi:diguanylate cyclase (GGDEF)-like protein
LLPGTTVEVAQVRALDALQAIRAMKVTIPGGSTLENITASIGLAVMPTHVARSDALVAAADAALYQAKGQGRNRVIVSDCQAVSQVVLTGTHG